MAYVKNGSTGMKIHSLHKKKNERKVTKDDIVTESDTVQCVREVVGEGGYQYHC